MSDHDCADVRSEHPASDEDRTDGTEGIANVRDAGARNEDDVARREDDVGPRALDELFEVHSVDARLGERTADDADIAAVSIAAESSSERKGLCQADPRLIGNEAGRLDLTKMVIARPRLPGTYR